MHKQVFLLSIIAWFLLPLMSAADTCLDNAAKLAQRLPLFKANKGKFDQPVLTKNGVRALIDLRDRVRRNVVMSGNRLKQLNSSYHAMMVARLIKGHVLLYGPSGGAKSYLVDYALSTEVAEPFRIQVDQMTLKHPFVGGEVYKEAANGRTIINTEGSLVDYTTALIDEFDKGNPAELGALLRILNEGEVLVGQRKVLAKVETVFATSNSNLPEIFQSFREGGQTETARAILARFPIKILVYNWLPRKDLANLAKLRRGVKLAEAMIKDGYSEYEKDRDLLQPYAVEWGTLRLLMDRLVDTSGLFDTTALEIYDRLRKSTIRAINESEGNYRRNPLDELFPYFPSMQWSTRDVLLVPDIVRASAFLDFLLSPLADDEQLKSRTFPIVLDPMSLWRAYLAMTTVGPSTTSLTFNLGGNLEIDFDWNIDESELIKTELFLYRNLKGEQKRFSEAFLAATNLVQREIKSSVENSVFIREEEIENFGQGVIFGNSFELELMRSFRD
jgi:hypothetical protein